VAPSSPSDGLIAASDPPKDPVLMGILSGCLIVGLGQIILGQTAKGIAILLGSMALAVVTAGISIFITIPAAGVDAYLIAKKLKEGKAVGQWEFF
jgi:TM2 domain-containing membrane protein YozV